MNEGSGALSTVRSITVVSRLCRSFGISAQLQRAIIIVASCAVIVRMLVLVLIVSHGGEAGLLTGDSRHYMGLAQSVLSGNGYMYDGIVDTFRAPGYPAFFMFLQLLRIPLWLGSIIQILIASGIACWVVWFTRVPLQRSISTSLIAGLFAALEPVQVFYSVLLLPDVLFAVAALATFTWMLRWFETGTLRFIILAGIAIGIGNYIRPVMLYLPYFLALMIIAYAIIRTRIDTRTALAVVLIVLTPIIIMAPWMIHNKRDFGHFAFLSTASYTLYSYGVVATEAAYQGVTFQQMKPVLMERAQREAPDPNLMSFANSDYFRTKAIEEVRAHPLVFLQQYLFGLGTFWTAGNYQYIFKSLGALSAPSESVSYSMLLASQGPTVAIKRFASNLAQPFIMVALFDRLFGLMLFVASLGGLFLYRKQVVGWLIAIFFGYFSLTILSTVIGVEARHRYALNPIIFSLVCAALYALYARFVRSRPFET